MKKFVLAVFLIFFCGYGFANELTEDYFDMATNYCVQGNYREASNYLDKILLAEPNNRKVQDLRNGIRQIIQGNNRSFILSRSPAVKNAIEARKSGNRQGELNALSGGQDYWSYYFLGDFYRRNGEYSQAISQFVKAVNMKQELVECYLEIAICYYETGNYQQALTYLNQYLKINNRDDFAYALRAKCNSNLSFNDAALNDILTAQAIENNFEYKFLEGKILYNMRRYSQAEEKLALLEGEVQTAEFYKYLGLSQAEIGKKADAIINLEKSIILSEDDKVVNMKYNELKVGIANE